jgi:sporulation protein YlmC with PRC-barrel domain
MEERRSRSCSIRANELPDFGVDTAPKIFMEIDMKMLTSVTAIFVLLSTSVIAQQPAPPPEAPPAKPNAAQPAPMPETTKPMAPAPKATEAPASGAAEIMTTVPSDSITVTEYYKQNVYDPSDNKIGEVSDVLIDKEGRVTAVVLAVGGFLGMGEKDVVIPFKALQMKQKDNKSYLVVNATKDALKKAPGFKYDSNKKQWVPEAS